MISVNFVGGCGRFVLSRCDLGLCEPLLLVSLSVSVSIDAVCAREWNRSVQKLEALEKC